MSVPICTSDPVEDIGHGVTIERRYIDGKLAGVEYRHDCTGGLHAGWIPLKPDASTGWDLVSESPLTLLPSLLCPRCGHHGFVTDGKWVPA